MSEAIGTKLRFEYCNDNVYAYHNGVHVGYYCIDRFSHTAFGWLQIDGKSYSNFKNIPIHKAEAELQTAFDNLMTQRSIK